MSNAGPLTWQQPHTSGPLFLMGRAMGECVLSQGYEQPESGISIAMMAGGSVYQRSPALRRAPLNLAPAEISLDFQAATEEDYYLWQEAPGLASAEPVEFWFARPLPDAWEIRDASTTWTLSRTLPYGLVDFALYPPRAWIKDRQGPNRTEQTIITTGTPGAGEVKVNSIANSIAIETPDLTAEIGRLLVFRYHPLRLVRVEGISESTEEVNGLDYSVSLAEHVPERDY